MILTYELFLENLAPNEDDYGSGVSVSSNIQSNIINAIKNNNTELFRNMLPSVDKKIYSKIIQTIYDDNNIEFLKILFEYFKPNYNNNYPLRMACYDRNSLIVDFLLTYTEVDPTDLYYRAFLNTSDKIINLMIEHPKVNKNKLFNVILNELYEYDDEVFEENEYLLKLLIRKYDILNPKYKNISKLNPEDYDKWFELGLKKEYIENEN